MRTAARYLKNRHLLLLIGLVAFCTVLSLAAKDFVAPKPLPAKSYPAHDDHPAERVTIAVDPYDIPEKTGVFSVKYRDYDFLPAFMVISNDGDQAVNLTSMRIRLVTADNTKIEPSSSDDMYRRMSKTERRGDEVSRNPLPVPLPRKSKVGVKKEAQEEITAAQFQAGRVEPHTIKSGFLFFDIRGISNPLKGANIVITGIRDGEGQELMYFEISLEKYLISQPSH